ncbi:two-component system response regulator [Pseudoduganella danionis]|uniref:Response regulator n=1 Tax=Pseudoduganella danionis TaxID=1890295 RepID=A0ABW9SJB0_9BURK|nr:response regulator [Pseudoduganella danionis]MTW31906.1 response regulator [Pseudoduganella danionis]
MHFPVYAHPTLTVLVDDSCSFLRSLSFQLDPILPTLAFDDALAAQRWLGRERLPERVPLQVNFDMQNLPADQCNVAIDLERIYRICEQPLRFETPSVVVVDYSMPQMNGLEFCAAIAHLPCKKILFTGAADEKIAVTAFNRGLIDRYIQKSDPQALDQLEQQIRTLQHAYFDDREETLRDLVLLHHYHFLTDPVLARLIDTLRVRLGIVEHYVFPNPSGILLIDQHGKTRLLMIETAEGMFAQFEIARDSDAPPALLEALLAKRVLPFFHDPHGDAMYRPDIGDQWHRYCAAAQVCEGRQTYYWALFDLPAHYFRQPPYAYATFLSQRRALECASV